MATITIRNLDADVQRRLKQRAAEHDRSMEAEVRAILTDAVVEPANFTVEWVDAVSPWRGEDIPLPSRSAPRELDL